MLFLDEQGASRLMIFEQSCALLINFPIKFNLIFAGAIYIHNLLAVLSMLLDHFSYVDNSNVLLLISYHSVMLVLGFGLKESLRTISWSLALALALRA